MNAVTYAGHRARIDVDLAARTVAVTSGPRWAGVDCAPGSDRGRRPPVLHVDQARRAAAVGTRAGVGRHHGRFTERDRPAPRGAPRHEDDPFTIVTALGQVGIPMVPLDGKGRPAKVKEPGLLDGLDGTW
ncbi:hypothetical protein [Mycobacteroides abscessus]|uniref:hypothetical protein n=1 Tax=Mycobacteroides abscessus TaxID=36809 RepID=UPI000929BC22|nr:hypothetical protein [Mycobacteroides abscessus]SIJ94446.1 Uncharacterised protein [Mycobacteroides abscessus subsp. abscessus]